MYAGLVLVSRNQTTYLAQGVIACSISARTEKCLVYENFLNYKLLIL